MKYFVLFLYPCLLHVWAHFFRKNAR